VIGLVYLLWAPLGPEPVRAFARSYRAHRAGSEHELVVVLNDAAHRPAEASRDDERRAALLGELDGLKHRVLELERPAQDLAAYGEAARRLEHPALCLLNSYSVALADGWLGHLERALGEPGVALAGASASWESQAEWVRGRARHWPQQLAGLRAARRDYPRFPNPHIRTTAFAAGRQTLLELELAGAHDKRATYLLESGHEAITRRVLERGARAVVAGRDGRVYDVSEWPASATYRSGEQRNLLVADRRTEDWRRASPRVRRRLSLDAWGSSGLR
jgi:hypothetical protein